MCSHGVNWEPASLNVRPESTKPSETLWSPSAQKYDLHALPLDDSNSNLVYQVGGCAVALRRNARIIDEIDVTAGFAELAAEMNFVRPVVNDRSVCRHYVSPISVPYHLFSMNFLTVNGRHPAVELGLLTSGRVFTPNTVDLGPESRLMLITGPNMVN